MSTSTSPTSVEEENSGVAATVSYKGFGSFHSDNVEELIRIPDAAYVAPGYPAFSKPLTPITSFGAGVKQSHFCITPEFVFVNQGAFGGALKEALQLKSAFELDMEAQLLTFYDRNLLPWMVNSIRAVAKFVNCSPVDVVLVPNATYGVNAAMSLIGTDDVVAYLDTEYGAVYKMLYFRAKACGATLHEIPVNHLIHSELLSDDAKLASFIVEKLPPGCTAFVIDHITSTAAFEYPVFEHIIPALRAKGVNKIIVDGAHGPLQCPLDFGALTADQRPTAYVGNLHKWVACPKSVGFMWVEEASRDAIIPPVRSHGASEGFTSEFIFDGTRDYTPALCVPRVLAFWNAVGIPRVRTYCMELLRGASAMLCAAFDVPPVARHAPFMTLVRLPDTLNRGARPSAMFVQNTLHDKYKIEVPVKTVNHVLYLRLSAYVYNTMEEYEKVRDAVLQIVSEWSKRPRDTACPEGKDDDDGGCGAGALGKQKKTKGF